MEVHDQAIQTQGLWQYLNMPHEPEANAGDRGPGIWERRGEQPNQTPVIACPTEHEAQEVIGRRSR